MNNALTLLALLTKTDTCTNTNSVDADETAWAVSSGSTRFAILCMILTNPYLQQWTSPFQKLRDERVKG